MTHTTNPALSGEELDKLAAFTSRCGYLSSHHVYPLIAQARAARQAPRVDAGVQAATSPAAGTPRVDALMAAWDDDGATRGSAFIELRDLARELERAALAQAAPDDGEGGPTDRLVAHLTAQRDRLLLENESLRQAAADERAIALEEAAQVCKPGLIANATAYEINAIRKCAESIRELIGARATVVAPTVPAGYVLVPVEPTEAMKRAAVENAPIIIREHYARDGKYTGKASSLNSDMFGEAYQKMLAAAPAAQAQPAGAPTDSSRIA